MILTKEDLVTERVDKNSKEDKFLVGKYSHDIKKYLYNKDLDIS